MFVAACSSDRRTELPAQDTGPQTSAPPPYEDGFQPSSQYWDASAADAAEGGSTFLTGPVRVFAFGWTSCALVPGNVLKCWGRNAYGLVGNGDVEERDVLEPSVVSGIAPTMVAGGREHVCASDGTQVWCWGRNEYGALGHRGDTDAGDSTCKDGKRCNLSPTPITGLTGVRQIASGTDFSCALMNDRTVRCWGRNDLAQLGILPDGGSFASCNGVPCSEEPVVVPGLSNIDQIALGDAAGCARTVLGDVECWGRLYDVVYEGGNGVLRHYYSPPRTPTTLPEVQATTDIALGKDHACVVYGTSAVGCMGTNRWRQSLGDTFGSDVIETISPRPPSMSPYGFRRLALGELHACGLTNDNVVYCWGGSTNGQILGWGCLNPALSAIELSTLFGATDVSAGVQHTCVARANGEVHCFGLNDHGQIGGEIVQPRACTDTSYSGVYRQITGLL